jgi:hypothetical protein
MDFDIVEHESGGILKVSFKISDPEYQVMGHVRLLPSDSETVVEKMTNLLGLNDQQTFGTILSHNSEVAFSRGQNLIETQEQFTENINSSFANQLR